MMNNRREFLNAITVLGGLGMCGVAQSLEDGPLVQVGQIGTKHAHASGKIGTLRKYPKLYDVVGVVEPDNERWNQIKNTAAYKNVPRMTQEELLNVSGLKLVCVETEVKDLLAAGQACVAANKHIHLDKPAGSSYPRFQKLMATAKQNKCLVQMGYMYRYNPGFKFIFKAVEEGLLGDIFEVDGVMSKKVNDATRQQLARYAGGTMFELGCHLIDELHVAFGTPDRVTPFVRKTYSSKDKLADNMLAVFDYPQITATIRSAVLEVDGFRRRQFVVVGSEGTIILRPLETPKLELTLEKAGGGFEKGSQFVDLPSSTGRYDGDFMEMAAVLQDRWEFPFSYQHDLDVQKSILLSSEIPLI